MLSLEERNYLKELDERIALGEAIEYLNKLPQFQLLLTHYLEKLPLELTYSLGGIEIDGVNEHNVTKRLTAIAKFKQFLDESQQELEEAKHSKATLLKSE